MRGVAAAGIALALGVGVVGMAVVASAVSFLGGAGEPAASPAATSKVPPAMLALYQDAAATCPGLPWTVLAAIGTVESDNGLSDLPGVHGGANAAGAEGPMQFEPATFAEYSLPVPPGGAKPPSPYDPTDAVYAASRLLCTNGASGGANIPRAIYAYNHSDSYVQQVLALAQTYAGGGTGAVDASATSGAGAGAVAVQWALAQIGTPYVWGGETPGVGFDCSGLVQAAYAVAGLALPRVAQDQFDATPKLGPATTLAPGDLVFFGSGPSGIDHVGLYVGAVNGQTVMVDAPYTGADVRAEAFPATVGAPFGSLVFVGATRP
ncbi:MAG TPA: NlpC/P60 family protein [Acidimicrobiales bacterium]|nr:NlpC/P60 family protein [Acidimicrobiales bacterium]